MGLLHQLIVLLSLLALIHASNSAPAPHATKECKAPELKLRQRISRADYVLQGKVKKLILDDDSPFLIYEVEPIHICKKLEGIVEDSFEEKETFIVKTSRLSNTCGQVALVQDNEYILFLRASNKKNHGLLDSCLGLPLIASSSFDTFRERFCQSTCLDSSTPENNPANPISGPGGEVDSLDGCLDVFMPVCGADGTTYSSECRANEAGVSALCAHECPCIKVCEWKIVEDETSS